MASNEAAVTGAGDEVASGRSHYWLPSQRIRILAVLFFVYVYLQLRGERSHELYRLLSYWLLLLKVTLHLEVE